MEAVYQKFINAINIKKIDGTIRTDTLENTNDVNDYIHCWLDRYIMKIGRIEMNHLIKYNGGVFQCMKLYTEEFGEFPINEKDIRNYQLLSYISVENYIKNRLDE